MMGLLGMAGLGGAGGMLPGGLEELMGGGGLGMIPQMLGLKGGGGGPAMALGGFPGMDGMDFGPMGFLKGLNFSK